MNAYGWLQIILLSLVVIAITPFMGKYLFFVFESKELVQIPGVRQLEKILYRLFGIHSDKEQVWWEYLLSIGLFSVLGKIFLFLLQLFQHKLPLNSEGIPGVSLGLAWTTAISYVTNTNWQSSAPESTWSALAQTLGFGWQNFVSSATGLAVAFAFARGITRRKKDKNGDYVNRGIEKGIGNFWVDLVRGLIYVFIPIAIVSALFFVSQGVIQSIGTGHTIITLEGRSQFIPQGMVASQVAIKILGSNGGGYFSANAAHPFENPNQFTNWVQLLLMLLIPAGLTYGYGLMCKDTKQGWGLFIVMMGFFLVSAAGTYAVESQVGSKIKSIQNIETSVGNLQGKEIRFGVSGSSLFASSATATSVGANNSSHGTFTPLGVALLLFNMQLGEVVFGGVGGGLYGMLMFALLTVFIAGLMVGRTPEYLGKKIEPQEIKWVVIYMLIFPLTVLFLTGCMLATVENGTGVTSAEKIHKFSEVLYAFTSATANNGSAMGGINTNHFFWHMLLSIAMIVGRFVSMVPVLAIAGSMVEKKIVPATIGTFPTNGVLFIFLLGGVIFILGALTFLPALFLGPIAENFLQMLPGKG